MPRIVSEIVDVYVFRRVAGVSAEVEFLMLRRAPGEKLAGTWQAVHGRIEAEEAAWQTGLRELREETGLAPVAFYQLDTVNTFYMAVDDTIHHCPCFAAEVAGTAAVVLNDEHDDFLWIPADAAVSRFIWPGQRQAVREIVDEIVRPGPAADFLRIRYDEKFGK